MKTIVLAILIICLNFIPSTEELTVQPDGKTICTRFHLPANFSRLRSDSGTFAFYLQNLPLKPSGELVKYYNGDVKPKSDVYCAVVDMEISDKDLQQCADAVMRLRGEYLFNQKKYSEISFRFTGDGKMHGFREFAKNDYSYKNFRRYMEYVFGYANTASLKKQLKPVPFYTMQIGDVLIQSGNPYGHAVIVVDLCKDKQGNKKFVLAQSYMPAQETQVLMYPGSTGPWNTPPERSTIVTPEWTFDTSDLRRW
jgi:hypothetical protein